MICPECGLETRVGACWVEVSGDDRPDTYLLLAMPLAFLN